MINWGQVRITSSQRVIKSLWIEMEILRLRRELITPFFQILMEHLRMNTNLSWVKEAQFLSSTKQEDSNHHLSKEEISHLLNPILSQDRAFKNLYWSSKAKVRSTRRWRSSSRGCKSRMSRIWISRLMNLVISDERSKGRKISTTFFTSRQFNSMRQGSLRKRT